MTIHPLLCATGGAATLWLALAAPGVAAEAPAAADAAAAGAAAPAAPGLFGSPAVSDARLAARRGGSNSHQVLQDVALGGRVSDNRAVNVSSGNNAIGGGAFAQATGLSTVIQNSGSNVLIQNATTVTVQLK